MCVFVCEFVCTHLFVYMNMGCLRVCVRKVLRVYSRETIVCVCIVGKLLYVCVYESDRVM